MSVSAEAYLRNLAAIIDRDGGQKQEGETIEQTAARCIEAVANERLRWVEERNAMKSALSCPNSDYGTHRCVRCDSEVE